MSPPGFVDDTPPPFSSVHVVPSSHGSHYPLVNSAFLQPLFPSTIRGTFVLSLTPLVRCSFYDVIGVFRSFWWGNIRNRRYSTYREGYLSDLGSKARSSLLALIHTLVYYWHSWPHKQRKATRPSFSVGKISNIFPEIYISSFKARLFFSSLFNFDIEFWRCNSGGLFLPRAGARVGFGRNAGNTFHRRRQIIRRRSRRWRQEAETSPPPQQ